MSNLCKHLKNLHPNIVLGEPMNSGSPLAEDPPVAGEISEDIAVEDNSPVWQCFEIVNNAGRFARCAICLKTLSFSLTSNLVKDLKTKHPVLVPEDGIQIHGQYPHDEEPEKLSSPAAERLRPISNPRHRSNYRMPVKHERSPSPNSVDSRTHETSKRARVQSSNESIIDTFGTYVTQLLKTLPDEVAIKLQGDIVTQIIDARIQYHQSQVDKNVVLLQAATTDGNCEISNSDDMVTYTVTTS